MKKKKKKVIDIWWYESRECWCADIPTPNGRKRLYLGKDEQKARAEFHKELSKYYESAGEEKKDALRNTPFFISLSLQFLEWNKSNRSPATYDMYKYGLKRIIDWFSEEQLEKLRADDITPTIIEKVKNELITQGKSAETINKTIRSAKRLYQWAMKQNLIENSPIQGVEQVGKYVNAPEYPAAKHLSIKQAKEFIEILKESEPMGDIAEFLLLTGMRIGEARMITWQDIDCTDKMIRLERHKTSERTHRPRYIPLSTRALEILEKQKLKDSQNGKTVFTGEKGQPLTKSAVKSRLKRLREKHPELKKFNWHKLRHTCATLLAKKKVPERVAQTILGHSSNLMTRYYTATDNDEMLEAVGKLSSMVNNQSRVQHDK